MGILSVMVIIRLDGCGIVLFVSALLRFRNFWVFIILNTEFFEKMEVEFVVIFEGWKLEVRVKLILRK